MELLENNKTEDNMSEEKITIDEKEYKLENFDDKQKYLVAQIKDLTNKSASLKFQSDQIEVAKASFIKTLTLSIENENETKDGDNT